MLVATMYVSNSLLRRSWGRMECGVNANREGGNTHMWKNCPGKMAIKLYDWGKCSEAFDVTHGRKGDMLEEGHHC